MLVLWRVVLLGCAVCWAAVPPAAAQQASGMNDRIRSGVITDESMNLATIGVITEGFDGTSTRIAADLSHAFDQLGKIRVLTMLGLGSVQNVADLIYLKGVDISIVQADTLEYYRRQFWSGVDRSVHYIAPLYENEVHVLARREITRLDELAGKKVSLDAAGTGSHFTGSTILDKLGIPVEVVTADPARSLELLRSGGVSAVVLVSGKPLDVLEREGRRGSGEFHLLPVPPAPQLLETYGAARLTSEDYPGLIAPGDEVDTVAVRSVMTVFNWPANSERYKRTRRFVDAFFSGFDELRKPFYHPKWAEVDVASGIEGWTRFKPAEEWLRRNAVARKSTVSPDLRQAFELFLREQLPFLRDVLTPEERAELFLRFEEWQQRSAASRISN